MHFGVPNIDSGRIFTKPEERFAPLDLMKLTKPRAERFKKLDFVKIWHGR
jgi:hypothetical protein